MTTTASLHETCEALFTRYPLAVNSNDSMTLMLDTSADPEFFTLIRWPADDRDPATCFDLCRWRIPDVVGRIEAETDAADLPAAAGILASCVPWPREGTMAGWVDGGIVTAVAPFHTAPGAGHPAPSATVMLPADGVSGEPFTSRDEFGSWFWDYVQSGDVISLDAGIGRVPGVFFWVTPPGARSGVLAVARDVTLPGGYVVPGGRFVWHESLRAGDAVSSLRDLLADAGATDLASRFQEG